MIGYESFQVKTISDKLLFAGIRFFLAGIIVLLCSLIMSHSIPRIQKNNVSTILILALVQTSLQYVFFYLGLANTSARMDFRLT